jgi:pSer/pThr/pTyr-binding forkhead associated (FHA) protein
MAPPKQEQPKPSAASKSPADAGATQEASDATTEEPSQSAAQPAAKKQMCANCGAENKLSDVYCYRCGQLLPSVQLTEGDSTKRPEQLGSGKIDDPSEQLPADTNRPGTAILTNNTDQLVLPKKRWGTARLDNEALIIFRVKDTKQEVHVYLQDDEVVMGRSFGEIQVDVDLTQHNAAEFGVSRRHAVLKRQNDNVVVTDLGSVNHTFLNGHQIIPNEFRILRDGDELRLGKLVLRVYFGEVM